MYSANKAHNSGKAQKVCKVYDHTRRVVEEGTGVRCVQESTIKKLWIIRQKFFQLLSPALLWFIPLSLFCSNIPSAKIHKSQFTLALRELSFFMRFLWLGSAWSWEEVYFVFNSRTLTFHMQKLWIQFSYSLSEITVP